MFDNERKRLPPARPVLPSQILQGSRKETKQAQENLQALEAQREGGEKRLPPPRPSLPDQVISLW